MEQKSNNHFVLRLWSSKWALALTSGIFLGLSYPPIPLPFLLFPAWIMLFRIADLCDSNREAAFFGYISFFIWNIITTYWLTYATPAGGVAAILANAAVMTLPFALQRQFMKTLDRVWLIALFQSAIWIVYEYLHHQWDLAWPWLALGNAWSNVPELIQYISVSGHLGISFWVLVTSALAYFSIRERSIKVAYGAVVLGLVLPLISLIQLGIQEYPSEEKIETIVVQPNFDTYYDYGGFDDPYQALDHLIQLSDSLRTDSTQLVVWPENGIRADFLASRRVSGYQTANRIKEHMRSLSESWNTTIITGAQYVEYYTDDAPPLSIPSGSYSYLYYNAALGFQPDGQIQIYRKHNLVPIVERVPFVHFLDTIDLFDWIDWKRNQGYGKGYELDPISVGQHQTPALVCYDSVFPSWIRKYIQDDAGFITIITNDGWWGNTSGHAQHFAYARLRAIEFRRWVVRSANNGISGIIDPKGGLAVKTPYWTEEVFRYPLPILHEQTLFARWGDWFFYTMLVTSIGGIIHVIARERLIYLII